MATKIRLARRGRGKRPFYHIVVADQRSSRDGKFIDKLGVYNPLTQPATIELDSEKAFEWIMKGAQPSETTRAILSYKGIMYKKHLQLGVIKGAFKQEEADKKFEAWLADKDKAVLDKTSKLAKAKEDARKKALDAEKKKSDEREAARKQKEAEAIAAAETKTTESEEEAKTPVAEVDASVEATKTVAEETSEVEASETSAETEEASPAAKTTEENPKVEVEEAQEEATPTEDEEKKEE